MATALRTVGHEDRLSLVEHLDELRTRLIVCLVTFVAATAFCMWQNNTVLDLLTRPLEQSAITKGSKDPLEQAALYQQRLKRYLGQQAALNRSQALTTKDPVLEAELLRAARAADQVAASTPEARGRRPVTLGVGEPFTVTLKVAAYAGLLLSLPILLFQAYAFILPAFSPKERRVAFPLMLMVPFLFIAGVVFGWLMVLPPAIRFLQNFNDDSYDILIQARDYYSFSILVLVAMGVLFQIPVGILAATRVGIVSVQQLSRNRRYAFLIIAVIAMALPGQDPVTMLMMMAPMYVLYEGSILLARLMDRRARRAAAREDELAPLDDED
jgi:sec-independent protein translocase protein TatC